MFNKVIFGKRSALILYINRPSKQMLQVLYFSYIQHVLAANSNHEVPTIKILGKICIYINILILIMALSS